MDDNDNYSGHNYHVPSSPAVQTCCAPSRRPLHRPQHSTRSDNSILANHKAPTTEETALASARQDEITAVCFFSLPSLPSHTSSLQKRGENRRVQGSADTCWPRVTTVTRLAGGHRSRTSRRTQRLPARKTCGRAQ